MNSAVPGVWYFDCRAKNFGNTPARASVAGISPWIRIQPFSEPKPATNANSANNVAALPPQNMRTTSANGAVDCASWAVGSSNPPPGQEQMYSPVVMALPQSVARGIVLSGSITLPAGTVADSSPRNAHRVSAADALTAERVSGCGSTRITDASLLPSNTIASTTIASNGITLSTVVTICSTPICRTPRQFRNVRIQ